MTYVAGLTHVRKRRFEVYIRTATTITWATNANHATLIGLMENIGKCEGNAVMVNTVGEGLTLMNDGSQKPTNFKGTLEIKHLNTSVANAAALEAFENKYVDIMLDDQTDGHEFQILVKNVLLWIDEEGGDGTVLSYTLKADKEVNQKSDFRAYGEFEA